MASALTQRRAVAAVIVVMLVTGCSSGGGGTSTSTPASSPSVVIGGVASPGGPDAFPAPTADRVGSLATAAGLSLETKESLVHHVHAHLDVFIDGEHRVVPAGIGIVITDPAVHTGTIAGAPSYGGILGCDQPCISPLHTHDVTGILHTESATEADNTLGQFFHEWDVRFDASCIGTYCTPAVPIRVYVDGKEQPLATATSIALTEHQEIAIAIGRPPDHIPDTADFSDA